MLFSHHSHSGQFCPGHARDSLEDIVRAAIDRGIHVLGLSEHMPRSAQDFYPEEVRSGLSADARLTFALTGQIEAGGTEAGHLANEYDYFQEAIRLRGKYAAKIHLLIGFESDWIREESFSLIQRSLARLPFEFFVGSVHHTHTIPIDYDRPMYEKARELAGGTDERLFEDYFDAQLDMLQRLHPPVVGHFDLIRLKSDDPNASFMQWTGVWTRILRNLDYIANYGGLVELNSAALRKGMDEPYPKGEICREFLARGGRFCLSDDSHGVDQVGLNMERVLEFAERLGIDTIYFLRHDIRLTADSAVDARFPKTGVRAVAMRELLKR